METETDPMTQPVLRADSDASQHGVAGVTVSSLDAALTRGLAQFTQAGGLLHSLLTVTVVHSEAPAMDTVPAIAGRYDVLDSGLRFVPHFPFDPGVSYRASFYPGLLNCFEASAPLTLLFSIAELHATSPAEVQQIYPTTDCLPENLLRFYIVFSSSMQRGNSEREIKLLGPDGEPAPDVLYRPPVELWDRSMRTLTILLDPGRLKRGVGPNRELGPPLRAGQLYTLAVGSGMLDHTGQPMTDPVFKRFRVAEPVRQPIAVQQWRIVFPTVQSRKPLVLTFPRPLDWALLATSIALTQLGAETIEGRVTIDPGETQWSFTPFSSWLAGAYQVTVHPDLEDVCGNNIMAPFDRPLRSGRNLRYEQASSQLYFSLA